ncbi:MAG TPA: ATP-binding protein [Cyclobacteriaceae bacterium]|nr:ATP-binding protein [Cyclobacteriaceae bacterium]
MQKTTSLQSLLILIIISVIILSSCNNRPVDVPFPVSDKGYPQPQSQPLQFSEPKKLEWIVAKEGIQPSVKKLDLDALPATPYDPNGFKPILSPPTVSHFDFNALRDTAFNLENIVSESLDFKTSILMRPTVVRVVPPSPKGGSPLSVLEIGRAQGIQEKDIRSLLRTRSGFICIGTGKGIYRFDGEYMLSYPLGPISGMIEDSENRIWYVWDGGLGMLDINHGTISISKKTSGANGNVPRMITDHLGNIWIPRIRSGGVDVIDPQSRTIKHLNRKTGLSGTNALGVFEDDKRNIWISTNDGADIINPEKGFIRYLKNMNGPGIDSLRSITGGKNGTVWAAFNHGGLHEVNIEKGSIRTYGKNQGFHKHIFYRLLVDTKGRVWMATNEGLVILDPEKGIAKSFKVSDGIAEDFILDLLQDDKQRIWVASFNAGLSIIEQNAEVIHPVSVKSLSMLMEDASGKIWVGAAGTNEGIQILDRDKKIIRNLGIPQGLRDDFIQNMVEVDGSILVGTNGGLEIIDLKRKLIEHTGKKEGLADEQIYGILKDKDGSIWLTGPALGINRIDPVQKRLLHAGAAQGLSENNISEVKQDAQGKIWIATSSRGVDRIDPENWTIQNLSNAPGLRDTCNRLLLPDRQGRMWIGTDKGIYVADPNQNTLTAITTKEGLCNDFITSLVSYDDNVIAGTRNKVSILRAPSPGVKATGENWKIDQLAASEGLFNSSNNWNTNMITRKGEYFWGDAGITIIRDFKAEQDSAATYITGLSVMSQRLNFANPVSLGERDTLWRGSSYFVKGQALENSDYVQQDRFHWDSLATPYNMPVNLRIPYDQNYLQFQFAQRHMGRTDATLYSYILLGIDKQWSEFNSNTFTENYLNLLPGSYAFKVRSQDISGRWGQAAVFNFTITPPWWKTLWAYSLYFISLVGSIGGFIQFRSKQLLRENRLLEEKVDYRTSQLKKSLDDLKSTQSQLIQSEKMASLGELTAGIAHEIQNPLNFVNNFSDVNIELTDELKEELNKVNLSSAEKLSLEKIAESIRNNQEKITFHGKRADSIVKGMLQHSRNSSGTKEPTNINALADEYLRLAYHGLRARDKSFNAVMKTDFDETVGMVNVVPQDVGRAILNLITNAFHAVIEKKIASSKGVTAANGASYEPTVTVSTKRLGNKVEIKVKDNAKGIPQHVLDKIFQPFFTTKPSGQGTGLGLSLSYDIVKAHGGELKVVTKEGEGSEFIVQLPV